MCGICVIFIPTVTAYILFYVLFSCILYDHKTKFSFEKFNKVSCILSASTINDI